MTEMKLVHVPLHQLRVSEQNARKADPDPEKLLELAASIEAHGLLVPLIISGEEPPATVIGGGRRLAAMSHLARAGKWEYSQPVACVLVSNGAAPGTPADNRRHLELSLAENTAREDLHPVDQAEAFRVLRDQEGATDKQLAARFRVSGRTVQRRLRVAQAAPELRKRCRDGELPLGVLEAACIEPDHARQVDAVAAAGQHHDAAEAVMRWLKKEAVAADSKLGTFVGLERYRAAGGPVSQNLSAAADTAEACFLDDKPLVQRLMMERLKEEAEKETTVNGWPPKQVKCAEETPLYYHDHWEYRTATKFSSLPKRDRGRAVLHLGMGWGGEVKRLALVKKGRPTPTPSSPIGEDAASAEQATRIPYSLVMDLRAMRLSVLRRVVSEAPDEFARDLLTFALARQVYAHGRIYEAGLAVSATPHPNLADSYRLESLPSCATRADEALSQREQGLLEWIAAESDAGDADQLADLQWDRFRELSDTQRAQLLTCCVARSLATSRPGTSWADRAIHAALEPSWPALFDPEAVILSRLTKAQLMEIARRDFPADVLDLRSLAGLKKAELVQRLAEASAEYRAAKGGSPWLPSEVFGD